MIPVTDTGSAALTTPASPTPPDPARWQLPTLKHGVAGWLSDHRGILGAMLFALAPAWIPYSTDMWSSGHYQYFPVLLAIVAYLIYSRRESLQSQATQPTPWVSAIGLVSVASLALAAHLLYSGFVGIVATMLACWVVVYALFGSGGLRSIGTVLSLLVFAVPLPLSLDQSLIVKMQFWASQIAAQLLDGLGIMHFRQGVILVTEKSQFMTEEACSGIRSLFSSLTFVCVLSVMQHHHWARAIFNLLQTIVWVILGNAVRVAAVVILADYVSPWFATGSGHEILGMGVFLFILMMVVSTDALVGMILFRPLVVDHELLSQNIVPVKREEIERSFVRGSDSEPQASVADSSGVRSKSHLAWMGAFVLVGLVGCWVGVVHTGVLDRGLGAIAMPDMPPPVEEDLPIVLGNGWQRTKFEHVHRDVNPILAQESYVYTYNRNGRGFVVSVDLPWAEWHNIAMCYINLGWEADPRYFTPRPQAGEGKTQSEVLLRKADRNGFVVFVVIDRQSNEVYPGWRMVTFGWRGVRDGLIKEIAANLGFGLNAQFALSGQQLPATTIQLMTENNDPLKDADREEFRSIYDEVRKRLLAGQRWK